jgi:hypothetical protein
MDLMRGFHQTTKTSQEIEVKVPELLEELNQCQESKHQLPIDNLLRHLEPIINLALDQKLAKLAVHHQNPHLKNLCQAQVE